MEENEVLDTRTVIPSEIHQLAKDIDDFWCEVDPYDEVIYGPRSNEDVEKNILHIASDIYHGKTETLELLHEYIDNRFMPETAKDAKKLVCRINNAKTKMNKVTAS